MIVTIVSSAHLDRVWALARLCCQHRHSSVARRIRVPAVQPNLSSTYAETDWIKTMIAIGDLVGELLVLRLVGAIWSRRVLFGDSSDDGGADGVRPDGLFLA
jgi:hypothetical protein